MSPHTRFFWLPMLAISIPLLVSTASDSMAAEPITGVWEGGIKSEAFPTGVAAALHIYREGENVRGLLASPYGVVGIESPKFEDDRLTFEFLTPLGAGSFDGRIDAKRDLTFEWKLLELLGTGEARWIDPASVDPIDPKKLLATFSGKASGPLVAEDTDVSVEFTMTAKVLGARVSSPLGEFASTKIRILHHHIYMEIQNEEELQGFLLGILRDQKLDIFWHIGLATGDGQLTRK